MSTALYLSSPKPHTQALREMADRYAESPHLRLREVGPAFITNTELLAVAAGISIETARELLADGWVGLKRMNLAELERKRGIGKTKAAAIKAMLEINSRMLAEISDERPQIKNPADVAALLMVEMGYLEQEHLRVVLLDTKNRVMGVHTVYIGSVNSAQVRIGEVFMEATRRNATSIIVAHNHPSGDPSPSSEDILVTRQIKDAGKLLDIELLDHLVIGRGRYVSMRERGLGFSG